MTLFVTGEIRKIKDNFYKDRNGVERRNYDVIILHPNHVAPVVVSVPEKNIQIFQDLMLKKEQVENLPVEVNMYETKNGAILRISFNEKNL